MHFNAFLLRYIVADLYFGQIFFLFSKSCRAKSLKLLWWNIRWAFCVCTASHQREYVPVLVPANKWTVHLYQCWQILFSQVYDIKPNIEDSVPHQQYINYYPSQPPTPHDSQSYSNPPSIPKIQVRYPCTCTRCLRAVHVHTVSARRARAHELCACPLRRVVGVLLQSRNVIINMKISY